MSIYIKEEPMTETTLPLVSIPIHEQETENFPPQREPTSFCALCVRECPAEVEIFEFNSENSADIRHSLGKLLGLEFGLQCFNICKTCCKMVRMIDNFREGCCSAQRWMERTNGVGLKTLDDWSSIEMGLNIEYLQEAIVYHTKQIEQTTPAEDELVSVLSIDQIKVQVPEVEEDDQKDSDDDKMFQQVSPTDDLLLKVSSKKFGNCKPEKKKFYCQLCDLRFSRIGHLIRHKQRTIHQMRLKILNKLKTARSSGPNCKTENAKCIARDDALLVVESVEEISSKDPIQNRNKCEECDIMFKTGTHLRIHKLTAKHQKAVEMYSEIGEYINKLQNETNDCDNERMEQQLTVRQKSSTFSNHKCPQCDAVMANKNSLRIHLKFVHAEASFECDYCGKKFKTKNAIKTHMFVQHIARRDFICPVCGNRYWDAGALQGHIMSHRGYRPFECGRCDKGYHCKMQLDSHILKHH